VHAVWRRIERADRSSFLFGFTFGGFCPGIEGLVLEFDGGLQFSFILGKPMWAAAVLLGEGLQFSGGIDQGGVQAC
jgi:hypothetical protein